MKKPLFIFLTVVLLFVTIIVGGCSQKTKETTADSNPKKLSYTVAVSGGTPAFNYLNKEGNPEGFEIDLMNAIAKEEGFNVNYKVTARPARMPSLKGGQIDIILAMMTITEERKKEVDFSAPYFEATLYMLVPADSQIQSLDDLKGKTVACALATTSDFAISKFLGKDYEGIKRYKDTTPCLMEVRNGKVDAAVADCGMILQYVKNNPEAQLRVVKDARFPKEYYGMAVRKGDKQTLQKINSGLKKIQETGKYEEIYNKWFEN